MSKPTFPRTLLSLDEADLHRDGPYVRSGNSGWLWVGADARTRSTQDLVDVVNSVTLTEASMTHEAYVAVEVPPGHPQLTYSEAGLRWIPRGDVLRCTIDEGNAGELLLCFDDLELNIEEVAELLRGCAGRGLRITIVPEELLEQNASVVIRDPDDL